MRLMNDAEKPGGGAGDAAGRSATFLGQIRADNRARAAVRTFQRRRGGMKSSSSMATSAEEQGNELLRAKFNWRSAISPNPQVSVPCVTLGG